MAPTIYPDKNVAENLMKEEDWGEGSSRLRMWSLRSILIIWFGINLISVSSVALLQNAG